MRLISQYYVLVMYISQLSPIRCLLWCVIAAKHPYPRKDGNASELGYYKQFESEINEEGITWPITMQQIGKFERMNKLVHQITPIICFLFHTSLVSEIINNLFISNTLVISA